MEGKPQDALAILKLYEIRSERLMRTAWAWFFSDFNLDNGFFLIHTRFQPGE